MKPVIVMPLFDPKGNLFPNLRAVTPQLKELFERAIVSIPPATREAQPENAQWAEADPFFHVIYLPEQLSVGKQFSMLYQTAAEFCPPEQIIHLAYIDRVAFALQTDYAAQFHTDIRELQPDSLPLCFERSAFAWGTHPQNYYELESMMTKAGEYLLGKHLDFGFCHVAIQAKDLRRIMPHIQHSGIAMVVEIILQLKGELQNREVDWLAWEDPFIEGVDAATLKAEREQSPVEAQKRLGYVIPALQMISDAAK